MSSSTPLHSRRLHLMESSEHATAIHEWESVLHPVAVSRLEFFAIAVCEKILDSGNQCATERRFPFWKECWKGKCRILAPWLVLQPHRSPPRAFALHRSQDFPTARAGGISFDRGDLPTRDPSLGPGSRSPTGSTFGGPAEL